MIGDDPVQLFSNFSLTQPPERLNIVPTIMAFHGIQWDFEVETLYLSLIHI